MKKTTLERFWEKVDVRGEDDCWVWTGAKSPKGYGEFWFTERGKHTRAHQVSWILKFGDIRDGYGVLHKCDNPPCVNPKHLFLGTNYDNTRDRDAKGRRVQGRVYLGKEHPQHGENSPHNKLTSEQVLEIVSLRSQGMKNKDIASAFGVSCGIVSNIWNGRKWAWLTGR